MRTASSQPFVAIACGGTGGHLFPGLAVGQVLQRAGCHVALLISHKEIDQEAIKGAADMDVLALPAVGLQDGNLGRFVTRAWRSYRICVHSFRPHPPQAVLAMGGFTSAPPVLAAKRFGAATFIHEANAFPGRANRWLAPWVDEVFVAFPEAASRLPAQRPIVTGMPVRPQFKPADAGACRMALGLDPARPVLLVTGGSQGASGVNQLLIGILPHLRQARPELQFIHQTGAQDLERVRAAYAEAGLRAQVYPFLSEMELALGAASAAISRAGASSTAEMAAMQLPAVLIPYPAAADNHQDFNARALVRSGAAVRVPQRGTKPEELVAELLRLLDGSQVRKQMQAALARWHRADSAELIAGHILRKLGLPGLALEACADEENTHAAERRASDAPDRRSMILETA
jgi:UDP-N-acetylglucosamine--N-acetylmuramyl-(pentapeptide) pyrophosphoryl-undecaprenol N-acetylglucosamine transferase